MRKISQFAICLATLTALAAAQSGTNTKPVPKPAASGTATKAPATGTAAKTPVTTLKPQPKAIAAPAKPSPKPAAKAGMAAPKPSPKPAKKDVSSAVAAKVAAADTKPSPAKTPEKPKIGARRDPFVNPITAQSSRANSASCGSGSHCLVISQIKLKGVVNTPAGPIAMVENESSHSYNLHEKDSLFNGSVTKITKDSIVFREIVTDALGRTSTREVVKKVTVPVV